MAEDAPLDVRLTVRARIPPLLAALAVCSMPPAPETLTAPVPPASMRANWNGVAPLEFRKMLEPSPALNTPLPALTIRFVPPWEFKRIVPILVGSIVTLPAILRDPARRFRLVPAKLAPMAPPTAMDAGANRLQQKLSEEVMLAASSEPVLMLPLLKNWMLPGAGLAALMLPVVIVPSLRRLTVPALIAPKLIKPLPVF